MSKKSHPLFHANVPEPLDERWSAKRETAKEIRDLIDVFITSHPSEQQLLTLKSQVSDIKNKLLQTEQFNGRMAWLQEGHYRSFEHLFHEINAFSGASNPIGPVLEAWFEGEKLLGKVKAGWAYEGPPSSLHGGFIAAIFDQFLGTVQSLTDTIGVTRYLTVNYHHLTPLNENLNLIGWIEEQNLEHRKILIKGEMRFNEVLTASAEALFVVPKFYTT